MAQLKNVVFLLSLLICVVSIRAQHCFPGAVGNVSIATNNRLKWTAAANPKNCTISGYIVNVLDLDDGAVLQYQTAALFLDLPNLKVCQTYGFAVHALTNQNLVGPADRFNAKTPAPASMNLTLVRTNITLNDASQLVLTWEPIEAIAQCISYYRVIYWDENNKPTDVYVANTTLHVVENLVPCMNYSFEVNALVTNPDIEGPITRITWNKFKSVPSPPKLVNILTTNSTVNMTWKLPSYADTRCALTELVVSTLGLPTNTSTSRINITDDASRPNVEVVLTKLSPNTVYTSHVTLLNSVGSSKAVTVTFQTEDN